MCSAVSFDEELFRSCSKILQDAYTFLMARHERVRKATLEAVTEWRSAKKLSKKHSYEIQEYEERLEKQFDMYDAEFVYALSHINSDHIKTFLKAARNSDFLVPPMENSKMYYYIYKLGYDGSKLYDFLKQDVHADGRLSPNESEHASLLRFYTSCKSDAKETDHGIKYWLQKWKAQDSLSIDDVSFALQSLFEFNSELYSDAIREHRDFLISQQQENGSFGEHGALMDCAYSLSALSLLIPLDDPVMTKGKKFLINSVVKGMRERGM